MASVLFVADFDLTITQKDTSYLAFKAKEKFIAASVEEKKLYLEDWNKTGKRYYKSYVDTINNALIDLPICMEFDITSLKSFSDRVDHYNLLSRVNLAEKKIFNDVSLTPTAQLLEEIDYFPSSLDILEEFNEDPVISIKILSVNWYPELIHHALKSYVISNDIVCAHLPRKHSEKMNDSSWPFVDFGPCSSSFDKYNWITKWMLEINGPLVYVGDSVTDLLALVEASYGIVFGKSENTFRVAKHFGISLKPLKQFSGNYDSKAKTLYFTTSWIEIGDFIDVLKERLGLK